MKEKAERILDGVGQAIIGKEKQAAQILAAILCGGHILIEDVPGVGKTTLAKAFARTLGCTFSRIQFTPDLMPADIIGISVYDRAEGKFVYKPGPIMSQVVLADELNRTSPRNQSSLLEAMAEGQVTVDGVTYPLPAPFIVLATQNPIEYEGTFPLPEAQLDRFMLRISLGYPEYDEEKKVLLLNAVSPVPDDLKPVVTPEELLEMKKQAALVFMSGALQDYIVRLVRNTRSHPDVLLGVSPRGGQHLYNGAKAVAFIGGREYVLPDDVKSLAVPVFSHRIILKPEARLKDRSVTQVLAEILHNTQVPVVPDVKV